MFRIGNLKSILTGGTFPYNFKYNKPAPQFTGGLFEYVFENVEISVEDLEFLFEFLDIQIIQNNPNVISNFLNASALPNVNNLRCGTRYNNERNFFKYTQLEAYNRFGIPCKYFKVVYDVKSNPISGEDSNMIISEMYSDVMVYCKLPRETKKWSKFGIEYTDNFPMFCSKEHFKFVSNSYTPQIGDYILIDFNSNLYEITEIKEEHAGYIQSKQYSWNFIVKPFRLKANLSLSESLNDSPIARFINAKDIFDISKAVDVKAETIMYKPKIGEKPQANPWQSR